MLLNTDKLKLNCRLFKNLEIAKAVQTRTIKGCTQPLIFLHWYGPLYPENNMYAFMTKMFVSILIGRRLCATRICLSHDIQVIGFS